MNKGSPVKKYKAGGRSAIRRHVKRGGKKQTVYNFWWVLYVMSLKGMQFMKILYVEE